MRVGIDTGGTFTDLIGIDDATGKLVVAKTPSTPARPVDAIMNAITLSGTESHNIEAISIGTTVATNALLERKGAAFTEIDIVEEPARRAEMIHRAGGRTSVPQIFINGEHIGGSDELAALDRAGELDAKLGMTK